MRLPTTDGLLNIKAQQVSHIEKPAWLHPFRLEKESRRTQVRRSTGALGRDRVVERRVVGQRDVRVCRCVQAAGATGAAILEGFSAGFLWASKGMITTSSRFLSVYLVEIELTVVHMQLPVAPHRSIASPVFHHVSFSFVKPWPSVHQEVLGLEP